MAKARVHSDPYRWNASTWRRSADWRKWELVGMRPSMDIGDLHLNWVKKSVPDLDFTGSVVELRTLRSMEQATNTTIRLRDPNQRIFNEFLRADPDKQGRMREKITPVPTRLLPVDQGWEPIEIPDLIGRAVEVELDNVVFRLVKVEWDTELEEVNLTFEDRIIYWLRRKTGEFRTSRNQVTRAEFLLRLLRGVREEKVPFICPELHKKQSIARPKDTAATPDDPVGGRGGFTTGQKFTVQGVSATPTQRRNMDVVLDEAWGTKGATRLSVKAAVEAVIQESAVKNLSYGDRSSTGILQLLASTAAGMHVNPRSIRDCVRAFMTRGFYGRRDPSAKGAVDLAHRHPTWDAGEVAQECQGSAFPDRYRRWSSEADAWMRGWTASGRRSAANAGSYIKSYQFARDKNEDSWQAMTRLAQEVNWHVFMVGRAMYFMSEDDLFRRRIRHLLTPNDPGFSKFKGDIDWGKPVSEATVTVNLDRWGASPGSVIQVEGFGPPDGRWIVVQVDRDWFSPQAEVTIRRPQNPRQEPASERVQRASTTASTSATERLGQDAFSGTKTRRLWEAANFISKRNGSYLYGGQHGVAMSRLRAAGRFDCSSSTSYALYLAGLWDNFQKNSRARVSGEFSSWGVAGRGEKFTVWYHGGHVFIWFESGMGVGNKRFDTSRYGTPTTSGAHVRTGSRPTSGFSPRHWPGL